VAVVSAWSSSESSLSLPVAANLAGADRCPLTGTAAPYESDRGTTSSRASPIAGSAAAYESVRGTWLFHRSGKVVVAVVVGKLDSITASVTSPPPST
jgi:hypothetical protein